MNDVYVIFTCRPNYKFGLGKRAEESLEDYENYDVVPIRFAYVDDNQYDSEFKRFIWRNLNRFKTVFNSFADIKRSKPFRFGLGKRGDGKEQQQRRSSNSRYNFGLGKR